MTRIAGHYWFVLLTFLGLARRESSDSDALRDSATMTGDVDVLGQYNYLDVWNHDRFLTKLQRDPYTDDDARALSEFGI